MEIELPNIQKATSSDYWSLARNQYPSGKFPKVSIGIPVPRAGSVSRSRDAATIPASERNLSQATDGRSRPPKGYIASLRISQEAANHDGSATEAPEAAPTKVSVSQPDNNVCEQTGTFSFGTRKEQGSQIDQLEKTLLVSSQGKRQVESADKTKPNSEVLRMKLWEILGGTSQTKEAVASPNPEDIETSSLPKSRIANIPSSGNTKLYTSPVPDNIKTPDLLNCQTANHTKCKPSSDPIESDSDTPQVVEIRPVTRTLGRKRAPAASKQQDKSAKKPLSATSRSAPKQKMLDNVFVFNEKCTPKTVGKSVTGNSGSLRNLRSSNKKAKVEHKKIHYSDRISDKTTQDDRGRHMPSQNAPSENKREKTTSFSSLSRTGKTAESCSRRPKREKMLNGIAEVGPRKMQISENLLTKALNGDEDKLSSQNILSKGKGNCSSLHQKENDSLNQAPDRSPQAEIAGGNNFNSPQSGAASPSHEPKTYPWDREASPQIHGTHGEKFASPLADRYRDMPDDFASPTFAANVNDSHQRSKVLDDDMYSPKYPKSVIRSRSSSYASDPESEPLEEMDKTDELPSSESPNSPEERENKKQAYLSPILPTEDEGTQISLPSFGKGYKSRKWLSDVDSPDKSPLEHLDKKSHLKEGRRGKRPLLSPIPSANGTQETIMSDKEPVQCSDDYVIRAFDQLLVVLGRFQTKIKSETSNKSSEILAATGEIIRQHLEGVEVQMQADVDKLVNAGKTKRKRLESTFEVRIRKKLIFDDAMKMF